MRTKVLCAAALAAGALTSMAQVYSANIVGYVNVNTPVGLSMQSNPLDSGNNAAGVVINNSTGQYDFDELQFWTGTSYQVAVFDSSTDDTSTGFVDRNFNPIAAPVLSPGLGYFFNNQGAATTLTYVGQVRTGTNTYSFPPSAHTYATGSLLPLSGGISSALNFVNNGGAIDFCEIQVPVYTSGGAVKGFAVSVFDSSTDDTSTGFVDRNFNPVPEPQIGAGQGFFFNNQSGANVNWQQILNP